MKVKENKKTVTGNVVLLGPVAVTIHALRLVTKSETQNSKARSSFF